MPTTALYLRHKLSGGRPLEKKNLKMATFAAFLILPMSGLITDMYIPSMPHMAGDLHQSENAIQLTLTLFLVSYGLVQFITGSLIDSLGRYRLTLISLILFIASNLVIAVTHSILVIDLMRVVQGIATGFIVVAKRAFFVDAYEGEQRKKYLSMMSIIWSVAPVAAPFAGGYLQQYFNWQSNFYVLAFYGLIMLIMEGLYGGETTPAFRPLKLKSMVRDYKTMMKEKLFVNGMLICGLSYGTTMIFGLSGAFIIEYEMHFSPVVAGYASLLMGLAWMTGGIIGRATINRPLLPKLRWNNTLQLIITLLMIITGFWAGNIYTLILFAFLIHAAVGFAFNNYFAFAMGRFPKMAGLTSGLIGGGTFLITAVASYTVVGIMSPHSQMDLGSAYLIMGVTVLLILQVLMRSIGFRKPAF